MRLFTVLSRTFFSSKLRHSLLKGIQLNNYMQTSSVSLPFSLSQDTNSFSSLPNHLQKDRQRNVFRAKKENTTECPQIPQKSARKLDFRASFKFAESFQHTYSLPVKPSSRESWTGNSLHGTHGICFSQKNLRNGNVIPKIYQGDEVFSYSLNLCMKREVMRNSNRGLGEEKGSRRVPSCRQKLMKESSSVRILAGSCQWLKSITSQCNLITVQYFLPTLPFSSPV